MKTRFRENGQVLIVIAIAAVALFAFAALAPPRPRRPVHFLARDDFFRNPLLGFLLRRLGTIPAARMPHTAATETVRETPDGS